MKRPSNVVLGFILAVAATFVTWLGWLIFFEATQSPEVEIEEDYESQLDDRSKISVKSELKIASQVNSNKRVEE